MIIYELFNFHLLTPDYESILKFQMSYYLFHLYDFRFYHLANFILITSCHYFHLQSPYHKNYLAKYYFLKNSNCNNFALMFLNRLFSKYLINHSNCSQPYHLFYFLIEYYHSDDLSFTFHFHFNLLPNHNISLNYLQCFRCFQYFILILLNSISLMCLNSQIYRNLIDN